MVCSELRFIISELTNQTKQPVNNPNRSQSTSFIRVNIELKFINYHFTQITIIQYFMLIFAKFLSAE